MQNYFDFFTGEMYTLDTSSHMQNYYNSFRRELYTLEQRLLYGLDIIKNPKSKSLFKTAIIIYTEYVNNRATSEAPNRIRLSPVVHGASIMPVHAESEVAYVNAVRYYCHACMAVKNENYAMALNYMLRAALQFGRLEAAWGIKHHAATINAHKSHREDRQLKKDAKEFWIKNILHNGKKIRIQEQAHILGRQFPLKESTLTRYIHEWKREQRNTAL